MSLSRVRCKPQMVEGLSPCRGMRRLLPWRWAALGSEGIVDLGPKEKSPKALMC